MHRKAQILVTVVIAVIPIITALWIGRTQPGGRRNEEPSRVVTDMTGRMAHIPIQPRRILSLCTSATDTIVRLGVRDRLRAIDEYSRIVPGVKDVMVVGKGSAISQEQVIALEIDLAFLWWYQDDAANMLEELSVPVVRIRSGRAVEAPGMIRLIGLCPDCPHTAEGLAEDVIACIRTVEAGSTEPGPNVYLELYGSFKTVGGDSYINDLIEFAGGKNIADDATGSVLLSPERLIRADPDVILFVKGFSSTSVFAQHGGMAYLSAVRAGRVYPIDRYWLVAGAGLPDAVENIHRVLVSNFSIVQQGK